MTSQNVSPEEDLMRPYISLLISKLCLCESKAEIKWPCLGKDVFMLPVFTHTHTHPHTRARARARTHPHVSSFFFSCRQHKVTDPIKGNEEHLCRSAGLHRQSAHFLSVKSVDRVCLVQAHKHTHRNTCCSIECSMVRWLPVSAQLSLLFSRSGSSLLKC